MGERVASIILAGGSGERMDKPLPKQFLELAAKPVIIHTLNQFEQNSLVSDIIVVCHREHIERLKRAVEENKLQKIRKIIPGGNSRQESSFIGIKNCLPETAFVLIHDAVRPFINEKIIKGILAAAKEVGAAGPVINTEDTIVVKKDKFLEDIPERQFLKRIQTPQCFQYEIISEAHKWALKNDVTGATDDCTLVFGMGHKVKLIEGSLLNIKLTSSIDLFLAEKIIQSEDIL